MAESEQSYLLELWDKNVCPNCGKSIPEGRRVGSGKKSEGGFCSLDCYAEYYRMIVIEQAKAVARLPERHRRS
jgi:hypothetical protein